MELYIFNPEHDMALGNNNENYLPPCSVRWLAAASEMLPAKYAPPGSLILKYNNRIVDLLGNPVEVDLRDIVPVPWGWDKAVVKRLILLGIDRERLPSPDYLDNIRRLSHRQTAVRAMDVIKARLPFVRTELPVVIHTMDELTGYLSGHGGRAVFKAPWSGCGKGVITARKGLNEKQLNRCAKTIAVQGSVIAERLYEVVQDFAMEFWCCDGKARFLCHSLFSTRNGAYLHNEVLDDCEIVNRLLQYVSSDCLDEVRAAVAGFLDSDIASSYNGPVGVDMFVYNEGGCFMLDPMVEINLRFTMGMANCMNFCPPRG